MFGGSPSHLVVKKLSNSLSWSSTGTLSLFVVRWADQVLVFLHVRTHRHVVNTLNQDVRSCFWTARHQEREDERLVFYISFDAKNVTTGQTHRAGERLFLLLPPVECFKPESGAFNPRTLDVWSWHFEWPLSDSTTKIKKKNQTVCESWGVALWAYMWLLR